MSLENHFEYFVPERLLNPVASKYVRLALQPTKVLFTNLLHCKSGVTIVLLLFFLNCLPDKKNYLNLLSCMSSTTGVVAF